MSDAWMLALAGAAGSLLGAIFFAGLWWTVRKGLSSDRPAPWFLGSLLLRMSIVLAGFYLASGGHWDRALTCVLGLLMARSLVTRLTRPTPEASSHPGQEAHHAPHAR